MLISQVEHARLSYALAEHWGAHKVKPLWPRDEILAAILHHDDGWAEWEREPEVDRSTGHPLSFLEMPIDDAVAIWERSISVASQIGPLAAYIVSSHFAVLVSRAHEAHASNPHWLKLVDDFLDRQTRRRSQWLTEWQSAGSNDEPARTKVLADRALAQLQLLDALSLWLCMAERTEPDRFETPDGPELTWTPHSAREVTVSPWPWVVNSLTVFASGRLVPAIRYESRKDLARSPSEAVQLEWLIRPTANPTDGQNPGV
jgi:hypothetical protein